MAGFSKSGPASKVFLFLAAVALFSCGLLAGVMYSGSGPKNLRAGGQTQQQELQQEEEVHKRGLSLPADVQRPKPTNLAALRSLGNEHEEKNKPDDFVWPGNFAYETFHALDEVDTLVGNLPDYSALAFTGSFSFSFEHDN